METRETYYELYIEGDLYHKGPYKECKAASLEDELNIIVEIYKVTVTEEKVL